MNRKPRIIAHRGASSAAPENTLAAFRLAVESGADGIEFDVRLSRDGVPVVIHDADLVRTAGMNKLVADMTAAELGRVDNGSWFNAKFAGEYVPTLEETLDAVSDFDGAVYIELNAAAARSIRSRFRYAISRRLRKFSGTLSSKVLIRRSFRS